MNNTIVTLKKGEGRTIKAGGAWIYDNEIDTITGSFKNGDIVKVHDFDGYPMGSGCINQNSKIRIRMISRKSDQEINDEFWKMRATNAWKYRRSVLNAEDMNCCRIIFGEADWIPGMVVDKYNDVLVVESLSLGIDRVKEVILQQLVDAMQEDGFLVKGIYERSDATVRKKEGMALFKGFLYSAEIKTPANGHIFFNFGEFDTDIEIIENNVRYTVDIVSGQKTGFFLDQKYNRLAMQRVCAGFLRSIVNMQDSVKVLDCFTHMGTFALNCGRALIDEKNRLGVNIDINVTGLDISEYAVSQAASNAKRNGLDKEVHFRAANVLDELPLLLEKGEKYDIVILDPPAFTKSKEATKNAIKGYREINIKGLKLVKDGGYFATCSCSHFMTQELFSQTIAQAAKSAHKRLRQVEFRTQAPDHPILWAADESYYLKFFIFQIVEEK